MAKPGDRLFVGTTDLRKTPLSDAYLYYMLPEYPIATRYIEMDPGVANAKGSGLASELRSADVAILSGVWDDWSEPNDSRTVRLRRAQPGAGAGLLRRRELRDQATRRCRSTSCSPAGPRESRARPARRSRTRPGT